MHAPDTTAITPEPADTAPRHTRRWLRPVVITVLLALFTTELVLGWPSLAAALSQLRAPRLNWFAVALVAEVAAMGCYARMQRRLLRSAGVIVPIQKHVALAYAAHSLSVTLPGGPAFSTHFNYQQMRRFGATPAIASWCIALSGILSAAALAVVTAISAIASDGSLQWHSLVTLAWPSCCSPSASGAFTRHPEKVEPPPGPRVAKVNKLRHLPETQGLDRIRGFVEQLRTARLQPPARGRRRRLRRPQLLLDAGCLWLCFHAISDTEISNAQLLLAFCAGMAAGTLTIIPGGLGIIDSALVLGLVTGGVATSTAIATVVLYRIISFGFIIGVGWITCWSSAATTAASRSSPQTPTVPRRTGVPWAPVPVRRPVASRA